MTSWTVNAWGDVGRALYDLTDVELRRLAVMLEGLAAGETPAMAAAITALGTMVETEQRIRFSSLAGNSRSGAGYPR